MRTSDICPTCSTYYNALCVIYNGHYLPNTRITPLDSLETALIKIEAFASNTNAVTPTLQGVTDQGYTTTNPIEVAAFTANGAVTLNSVAALTTAATKYLVLDGSTVKTRTAAELIADIGALTIATLNEIGNVDETGIGDEYHLQYNLNTGIWGVVPNKTKTSEFTNDGADSVNPFITALALSDYLPLAGGTMLANATVAFGTNGQIVMGSTGLITTGTVGATTGNITNLVSTTITTSGAVTFNNLTTLATAATKFLVLDGATVKSRTAVEARSDIGAAAVNHTHTVSQITDFEATQNNIVRNISITVNATPATEKDALATAINFVGLTIDSKEIYFLSSVNIGVSPITENTFVIMPGKGTYNTGSPLLSSQILFVGSKVFSTSNPPTNAVTIDLGIITPDTIEDYLNNVDPISHVLGETTIYFFTTTEGGVDKTYLYVGTQPNTIGNGGTPVTANDFSLVAQNGQDLNVANVTSEIYVHAVLGDDATGKIGDPNFPFETIEGVFDHPEFSDTFASEKGHYNINLETADTYVLNGTIPSFYKFTFKSKHACTLDLQANTVVNTGNITTDTVSRAFNKHLGFDMPNGVVIFKGTLAERYYINAKVDSGYDSHLKLHAKFVVIGSTTFLNFNSFDIVINGQMTSNQDVIFSTSDIGHVSPSVKDSKVYIQAMIGFVSGTLFANRLEGNQRTLFDIYLGGAGFTSTFEPVKLVMANMKLRLSLGSEISCSNTLRSAWFEENGTGEVEIIFDNTTLEGNIELDGGGNKMTLTGNVTVINTDTNTEPFINNDAYHGTSALHVVFKDLVMDYQGPSGSLIGIDQNTTVEVINSNIILDENTTKFILSQAAQDYTGLAPLLTFRGKNTIHYAGVDDNILIDLTSATGVAECWMYGTLKTNGLLESVDVTDFTIINKTKYFYPELPLAETRTLSQLNPLNTDIMPLFRAPYALYVSSFYEAFVGGAAPTMAYTAHRGTTLGTSLESNANITALTVSAGDWVWLELDTVTGSPYMYTVDVSFYKY